MGSEEREALIDGLSSLAEASLQSGERVAVELREAVQRLFRLTGTAVQPGSFQRNPTLVATASLTPVPFWSADFTLLLGGDVLFLMSAISFMVNGGGAATIMGVEFTADVDGVALTDVGLAEINGTGQINTYTTTVVLQSVASGLAAGPHTLNLFMHVYDVNCTAQTAINEATLRVGRL